MKRKAFKKLAGHRPFHVVICVPSRGVCAMPFVYDFVRMVSFSIQTMVQDGVVTLQPYFQSGTYIHSNRIDLAKAALQDGADYLLWLDDDMRFPPDVLLRLLNHRQDIVGANYCTRGTPARFVGFKRVGSDNEDGGDRCLTLPNSTGLEAVDALGFGCILIRKEVFLRTEYPWFQNRWDAPRGRFVGEDVHFCLAAKEAGFQTYVDHDLSKEIGHEGQLEYRVEHAQVFLETDAIEAANPLPEPHAGPSLVGVDGEPISAGA